MRKKFLAACGAACLILIIGLSQLRFAAADTFNANRIIDDAVFNNSTTMNPQQIDAFINHFSGSCISTNNGFSAPDPTGYSPSGGYRYGGYVSAGQVIYDAAQAYNLNPQVILSTLQKEEGLVQGNGPYGCSALALSASLGYGCPDSGSSYSYSNLSPGMYAIHGSPVTSVEGTCVNSAGKAGFSQQVIHAVWLFKFGEQRSEGNVGWSVVKGNWNNSDDPQTCYGGPMTQGNLQRCPNTSSTYYDGYDTIDNTAVHMDNGATAALYWYTPHFHGNQVFFDIFTGWFGSTQFPFSVVQVPGDPGIYIKFDGMKQLISDLNTYKAWGFDRYPVQTISGSELNSLPTYSSPLTRYVNSGSTNYYIDASRAYSVAPNLFYQWGYFNGQGISPVYSKVLSLVSDMGGLSELVTVDGSSAIYLMDGGKFRPFTDFNTFTQWQPAGVNPTHVSSQLFSEYPTTSSITSNLVTTGTNEYLVSNGAAYSLVSGQRAALPSSWTEINIDQTTINSRGKNPLSYSIGAITDPAIYLLDGGQKRPYASYDLYNRYSKNSSPSILNPGLLSSITTGGLIDRSLFSQNGTNGILDAQANLLCFDANSAQSYATSSKTLALNSSLTLNYLLSRGCSGTPQQFVKINSQPAIYALSGGTKLLVPDLNTLYSYGVSNTTSLSTADGSLFSDAATLNRSITDGTTNYRVDGGKKFSVTPPVAISWNLPPPLQLGSGLMATLATSPTPLSTHINIGGVDYLIDTGKYFRSPSFDLKILWGLQNNSVSLTNRGLDGLANMGDLTRLAAASNVSGPYANIIYAVDNGSVLYISSLPQLFNLRFPGNPIKLTDSQLNNMGAGSAAALHPYLLKDSSNNYFVVNGGSKQIIISAVMTPWTGSQTPSLVSDYFLTGLLSGGQAERSIASQGNPVIFYMNNGQKVPFSSYTAYLNSGYGTSQISSELMSLIPSAP